MQRQIFHTDLYMYSLYGLNLTQIALEPDPAGDPDPASSTRGNPWAFRWKTDGANFWV